MSESWSPELQTPWPGESGRFGLHRLFVRRAMPDPDVDVEPAVMVHGLGGQSMNWTDLMALLRHRLDSVAPDLPGFGRSAPPDDGDYRLDAFVDVVREVVASHRPPVHLFGNSMGGAIAVRLAARHPELVRSLVLVSPALPDLRPRRSALPVPVLAVPGVGERVWLRIARMPPEQQVDAMLRFMYGDPSLVPASRIEEAVTEYRRRFAQPYAGDALSRAARGLIAAHLDPGPSNLWREAARLDLPVLSIYGGRDKLVNARRARRAARTIRGIQVVVLPGAGHVAQMEQPQLVGKLVERFLDGVGRR